MANSFPVRAAQPSDLQTFSEFRSLIGDHAPYYARYRGPDFYRWKYFEGPVLPTCVRLAEDEGKLVGSLGCMFRRLKVGDRTLLLGELIDGFVHPEYRRRGLFSMLIDAIGVQADADGVDIIFGKPNDNSFPAFVKMGYEEVFQLKPMAKVLDSGEILRQRVRNRLLRGLARPLAAVYRMLAFRGASAPLPAGVTVTEARRFDPRVDDLWRRVAARQAVSVVRDREYLSWRYNPDPCGYGLLLAHRGESLVGFVVFKQEEPEEGMQRGYIADLLVDPDLPDLAAALIREAVVHFRKAGVGMVTSSVLAGGPLDGVFARCGFKPGRKGQHFIIKTEGLSEELNRTLADPANWFFTIGDTDGV